MKKKYMSALVVAIAVTMLFVGLAERVQASNETLKQVIQKGVVRVGILPDFAPWSYRDSTGEFVGYDVDIAMELGAALGVQVELVPIEAPNRVPALVSNRVDVMIACLTPTDERAKSINFTIPYASAGLIPMVRADNDEIKTYQDLAGKTVLIVRGGIPDLYLGRLVPDANLVKFDTIADAYTAFKTGRGDAFVEEDSFVLSEVKKYDEYKAVGESFTRELLSIATRKNDQEWLNYLNNFVTNMRFTGKNAELYIKWFGQKPAPLNVD